VEFLALIGPDFQAHFASIGFNFTRLAGARVLAIEGQNPYGYVDNIASTVSGNYLDHGVRVNSVFTSYRISGTDFSQRLGDAAGPTWLNQDSVRVTLIPVGSVKPETVDIPFVASYLGQPFTDQAS
jgi:hypothetical protein